uniref:contactin-2-like n=1 Tax=Styela clava TaxID=7725 RepID=UPI00193AC7C5|nr:contactin-2-like [Styela clava]
MGFTALVMLIFILDISLSKADVFSLLPETQKVPMSSTADITFPCRAGKELTNPQYTWKKNGVEIAIEGRLKLIDGTLVITEPQAEDMGKYMCIIQSDQGTVASNYAELIFQYLEGMSFSNQITINTNQAIGAELECGDFDYAPGYSIYFFWQKEDISQTIGPNGEPTKFISQKTGNLYLSNPTEEDSGKWVCFAKSLWKTDDGHSVVKSANEVSLTVVNSDAEFPPEFMVTPDSVTAVEFHGKTYLECFAKGNPAPEIQWEKLDGEMPESAKISNSGQLYFDEVPDDANGTYICTATNSVGSVTSNEARIDVDYPPEWIQKIESISADLESSLSMTCSATGLPKPAYTWYKNLEEIDSSQLKVMEDSTILIIKKLDESHAGVYQCLVENSFGNLVSSSVLHVNSYLPVIDPPMQALIYAAIGGPVTIECPHTAAPAAEVEWLRDDFDELSNNGTKYIFGEFHSLVINDVGIQDEASYTCKLTNTLGSDEGSTTLVAKQATQITTFPSDVSVQNGLPAELYCSATFDPSLTLSWRWYHDENEINDPFGQVYQINGGGLTIPSTSSKVSGNYKCCAETKVGTPCGSAKISVTAPPDAPTEIRVLGSTSTTQKLTWSVPFDNHAEITSYTIAYKNSYNSIWRIADTDPEVVVTNECVVKNLFPYNDYVYQISATNALGRGELSEDSTTFNTQKGAPAKPPRRIGGGGGNIGQLVVKWKPLSEEFYGSDNIEYVIAIEKFPEGEGVVLMLPPSSGNDTEENEDVWQYTTVPGGKTENYTFQVEESEVYKPYNVKIRADNELGEGPWSPIKVVTTFEISPDLAPGGISLKSWTAYTANLMWPRMIATTGRVQGYKVKIVPVAPAVGEEQILETKKGVPRVRVENLEANTVYHAYVAAFNGAGQGPWSEAFRFNTEKKPPSVAPKKVEVSIKQNILSAKWEPILYGDGQGIDESPLLGYKVEYWWSNKTSATALNHVTTENKISFSVANNSLFNVRVRGYSAGGNGVPSELFFVSTAGTASPGYIYCCGANTINFSNVMIIATSLLWMIFAKLDF